MQEKVGIIGAGRLGSSLAASLKKNGVNVVGISCKEETESRAVADKTGIKAFVDNHKLAQKSNVIFLTVPDSLIVKLAEELLEREALAGKILLHCSGAMSGFSLPGEGKVYRGSFHPLQSFAGEGATFKDIFIAMDGDPESLSVIQKLCAILGATPLQVPSEERALYHAAAVFASNYLVTVLATAEQLFTSWTGERQAAREAIMPLVKGSLSNFVGLGGAEALTGPITRGDSNTVEQHLAVLPKEFVAFYKNMGLQTLILAQEKNNLTPEQSEKIKKLLKES